MKLISLNVALFEANNDKVAEFLKNQKPDFLALQEVTRGLEKNTNKDFVSKDAIDDVTPDHTYFFYGPTSVRSIFEVKGFHGKDVYSFDFGGMLEFGNYTKSKYKMTKGQNVFVQNHFTFSNDYSNWPDEMYSAFLVTDHIIDTKPLRIINYHGIWTRNKLGNEKTLTGNNMLLAYAKQAENVIICGDFNLFPDTPSMNVFEKDFESLIDIYNIKTTRPVSNELSNHKRNVVDYIWVSKNIKVNNFEVVKNDISDHLPLIMEFNF